MAEGKVILVTGASRGIGFALCELLAGMGHTVYGGARSFSGREESLSPRPSFIPLALDVAEDESVKAGVERILAEQRRIDIVVNNAGVSQSGPVEECDLSEARRLFEVNYLGIVRVLKEVAGVMRSRGEGTFAVVGSAAGRIGIPFQAHYAASKFAVEGLCEALYHELKPFGIRVLLFEPGDVKTGIWEANRKEPAQGSPYESAFSRFLSIKDREMGKQADSPEAAARQIARVLLSSTRRLRHPVAKGARLVLAARKVLPDSLFLRAVARNYGLSR